MFLRFLENLSNFGNFAQNVEQGREDRGQFELFFLPFFFFIRRRRIREILRFEIRKIGKCRVTFNVPSFQRPLIDEARFRASKTLETSLETRGGKEKVARTVACSELNHTRRSIPASRYHVHRPTSLATLSPTTQP